MRLYLSGQSKHKIGYVPDWLKVSYKEEGKEFELTLDIQGENSFNNETLNCKSKGDLIPWTLTDCESGEETDLSNLSNEELDQMFPLNKIVQILAGGNNFRIGVYPSDDKNMELTESDVLIDCEGLCEIYDGERSHSIIFEFETELNV